MGRWKNVNYSKVWGLKNRSHIFIKRRCRKNGNKRPCYFCFRDRQDKEIIWFVPISTKNITTKRITIGKLDRTSPTITNISSNNKTITIEANDINKKLNKEGSGIKDM